MSKETKRLNEENKKLDEENRKLDEENKKLGEDKQKLSSENSKLKKKNKSGRNAILILILIILILAAVMFFFDPFGFGIGPNAGGGSQSAQSSDGSDAADDRSEEIPAETSVSIPEEYTQTVDTTAYTDVVVNGNSYILGAKESSIEDIISIIQTYTEEHNEEVVVKIFDNDATQNAMEELQSALDENGIRYIMQ